MADVFVIGLLCGITLMLFLKYIVNGIKEIRDIIKELRDKH
jgi:capsular polysaccharide biosynthesis protein